MPMHTYNYDADKLIKETLKKRIVRSAFKIMSPSGSVKELLDAYRLVKPKAMSAELKDAVQNILQLSGARKYYSSGTFRSSTARIKFSDGGTEYVTGPVRRTAYDIQDNTLALGGTDNFKAWTAYAIHNFLKETSYGILLRTLEPHWSATHNAYAQIDINLNRSNSSIVWHKDTWGYTLFVGLLYCNDDPISGPQVIDNPTFLSSDAGGSMTYRDRSYLPPQLKRGIDELLSETLAQPRTWKYSGDVPSHGMVAFIDELVHHSTPWLEDDPKNFPDGVTVDDRHRFGSGGVTPGRIPKKKGDSTLRTFIRLWITLVPKDSRPGGTGGKAQEDTRLTHSQVQPY